MVATPTKEKREAQERADLADHPHGPREAEGLQALAKDTRILQSTLLREAVEDMLVKRNCVKRGGE